jgi:putative MFS transporter
MAMTGLAGALRPSVPLGRDLWGLLAVVGTAFMASRYDFQLSTLALKQFQDAFVLSETDVGALTAVAKLGALPAVVLTLMADRIGRKPLFLWSIVGFSASALLVAAAQNAAMLTTGLFFTRLFTMVDELLAVVILAEAAPPAARAWMLGALSSLGAMGDGAALIAYGNFGATPDAWRWLYAAGAAPALATVWWRLRLPESVAFEAARASGPPRPLRVLAANRRAALLIGLVYFLFWLPLSPALSFVSKHLQTDAGWTPGGVALLTFAAGTLGLLGTVFGGGLADRFGRRLVGGAGTLLAGAGLAGAYVAMDARVIGATYALGLLGWFAASVAIRALMTELVPTGARATLAGASEIASTTGAVTGIALMTALIGAAGGVGPAIVWLLPAVIAPVVALCLLPETRGRRLEDEAG